jgi:hypothetical protein
MKLPEFPEMQNNVFPDRTKPEEYSRVRFLGMLSSNQASEASRWAAWFAA